MFRKDPKIEAADEELELLQSLFNLSLSLASPEFRALGFQPPDLLVLLWTRFSHQCEFSNLHNGHNREG
ncbi:hypothetical protein BDBG_16137 [Blastomyces gilchristii SLH14081]|uniref:Uncharacterized protein n=1 Tax=Blastomyces gilchristii (strain SLH14081) TaxID=559298 RepID=A0A179U9P3_BLAGS|nr:uncharacterized protein BDBG_16137 [Blastomyces gilchristii SLH14081]OAT03877.1 hypothetical protein BDBG_16137 [Blastomyces gilchristii SLH14081]